MLTIETAKTPMYSNAEKTAIDLVVKFVEVEEEVSFTASPDDVYEYGKELFTRAVNGDFGDVAPYIAPPAPVQPIQPTVNGAQTL